jgi:hypothetical protein
VEVVAEPGHLFGYAEIAFDWRVLPAELALEQRNSFAGRNN